MPSWLRLRGEFRERFEGFAHAGFTPGRDDTYWLSRLRVNAVVAPGRLVSATVQLQDARVARKQIGPVAPPFRGPLDLRMAYAEVGDTQKGALSLRAGRQELAFGEQRLIGHLNWTNTARTFDAVRATIRRGGYQVDLFGASVVRIQDSAFDKSGNGNRFAGAYGSISTLVPNAVLEPYFLWRADRGLRTESATTGDLDQRTIGVRFNGRLPAGLDYGIEMAGQTGSLGSDTVGAWAGHWQIRESFKAPWSLRVIGEFNFASGDADSSDGERRTFDQLYPTGHDKLGLSDQVGWRNIHHARAGVELTPVRGWPVSVSHHAWWRPPRCPLQRRRRGHRACGRRRHLVARRPGARRAADPRGDAADLGIGRLCASVRRQVSRAGHARRRLQLPVRHGDVRLPFRKVTNQT
jgi:hypothetical protein